MVYYLKGHLTEHPFIFLAKLSQNIADHQGIEEFLLIK